jgi:hypothetical protein
MSAGATQPGFSAQFDVGKMLGDILSTTIPIILSSLQSQPGGGLGTMSAPQGGGLGTMSASPGGGLGQPQFGAQFDWGKLLGDVVKTAVPIALSMLQAQPGFPQAQQGGGLGTMSASPGGGLGQQQFGAQFTDWNRLVSEIVRQVVPIVNPMTAQAMSSRLQ